MTIAPIRRSVEVKVPPARAFVLFAEHMEDWWPRGRTVGKAPHRTILIEPRAGGRWFETDEAGEETPWGEVLAWEPPTRLLLAWRLDSRWAYDPDLLTEVEVTFAPLDGGGTRVTLEHRHLEHFGADADKHASMLDKGWPGFLGEFAAWADAHR